MVTKSQILKCDRAQKTSNRTPTPSRMVSNGEYMPVLQSSEQKAVEEKIVGMADANSKRLGMTRRDYLRTSCGMAVAFLAMNDVFGKFFQVDKVEATQECEGGLWCHFQWSFNLRASSRSRSSPIDNHSLNNHRLPLVKSDCCRRNNQNEQTADDSSRDAMLFNSADYVLRARYLS